MSVLKARSRLGVATRLGSPDDVEEARRELAASKIERYVETTLEAAPPLTPEQTERIAALLRPHATQADTAPGGAR